MLVAFETAALGGFLRHTELSFQNSLIHMAEDAIETYLSALKELGEPIPKPRYRAAMVEARPPKKKVG